LILFSARFLWMHYYHTADTATVNDGVLHFNPAQAGKAKRLDGEWFFFADEYVEPKEIGLHQDEKALIPISEDWRSESFRTNRDSYGRGTYYLQIQLPEDDSHHTALYFTKIYSAAQFYVNGELISTYGNWD